MKLWMLSGSWVSLGFLKTLHENTHAHKFKWWIVALKFGRRNLQFLWPIAFVFGHEHLFRGVFMGPLPIALHYNYSAGMHPVPVMKWVLQWVDLSLSSHYSVFLLPVTRAEWQRIAAALAAWQSDRKRGGLADQPQNHRQQSQYSTEHISSSVRRNGELHFKAQ